MCLVFFVDQPDQKVQNYTISVILHDLILTEGASYYDAGIFCIRNEPPC